MDEGIAVLIAASLATLGIMFTGRQQRSLLRRQHTYQVIEKHNQWPEFDKALNLVGRMADNDAVPRRDESGREADIDIIDFLLNYYEFLSASVWSGDIDETLARECERGRVIRIFRRLEAYVEWNREQMCSRRLWQNHERLCCRWERYPDGPALFERIVEYMTGSPLRSTTDWQKPRTVPASLISPGKRTLP